MASRISQMRNAIPQQMGQPRQSQQQLNESIQRTRAMMQQVRMAQNPQAELARLLQNNPNTATIANMLKGNGDLENIARQMAQVGGYDINEIIRGLSGGM